MNWIRLHEVDESPHDSVTSDLASGQWRLAAQVDVLISNARCVKSLFSYIRPGYIHSGYNCDHGGTTEPERSRNVNLKRTWHPVFVLHLTPNDLLELNGSVYNPFRLRSELR